MFEKEVNQYKEEIIKNVQNLIKIPSVNSKSNDISKPFGEDANTALEYILNLGNELGFKTKNIDGYCGYIEFGTGDELVGIIGHLDVVPVEDNWTYPPFSGIISENKIYGRGSIDDKGPVISSLYAMKIIKDNFKLNKRVRLIIGLNEELDWKCIDYYKQHEEIPTIGFSPDADFPCIYAEKSILTCSLISDISSLNSKNFISIKSINCHNNAINVIPKVCNTVLQIDSDKILIDDFINSLKIIIDKTQFEIDIYKISNTEVELTSHGIASHAAHPDMGINAISRLLIVLYEIYNRYDINIEILEFFYKYINTQFDGKNLNINFADESGSLTLNVGKIEFLNGILKISMNLRIPIYTSIDNICNVFEKLINTKYKDIKFEKNNYKPALYVSKHSYLVKTLCNIYNEETNSNLEPIAIGGATYARAFKNFVSFGANFPGHKDMCHQTDEFIDIDCLLTSCRIYARAILKLGT